MTFNVDAALVKAPTNVAEDQFGTGVAISGNGLVMVASKYGWDTRIGAGGVYTHDRVGTAWVRRGSMLIASPTGESYFFGKGLALNDTGTVLAVGVPGYQSKGGVYIYDWSGAAWVQRGALLQPADIAVGDNFGASVALSADGLVMAISATWWEGATSNQGGVYIYDWSGAAWVQRGSVIVASITPGFNFFGAGVALNPAGDILAVGEPWRTTALSQQGAVHVFDWSGAAWVARAVFYDPTAADNDRFGTSVALAGNGKYLLVGSPQETATDQGRAYLFEYAAPNWTLIATFVAADAGADDLYGSTVAISNDVVTVSIGAIQWEGTQVNQGAVYTYVNDAPPVIDPPGGDPAAPPPSARPYLLTAYVSGAPDSLPDYPLTLTSFSLSKRSAALSYYAITALFSADLLAALIARPNGIVHILRDGMEWETFNIGHPIRYDIGPRSSSVSINGTRQETTDTPVEILIDPRYATSEGINSDGLLTLGIVPGFIDLRPADQVTWDGIDYNVSLIKYQAGSGGQTISLTCASL